MAWVTNEERAAFAVARKTWLEAERTQVVNERARRAGTAPSRPRSSILGIALKRLANAVARSRIDHRKAGDE